MKLKLKKLWIKINSILRNRKVSTKLLLIVVPAFAIILFNLVQLGLQTQNVSELAKKVYYDEVYLNTRSIMSAERAFYQASLAEKDIINGGSDLDGDTKKKLLREYEFKSEKVLDLVQKTMDTIKLYPEFNEFKFSGPMYTIYEMNDTFQSSYTGWKNAYDPATGEGDLVAKQVAFDDAIDYLNYMSDILDQYSNQATTDMKQDSNEMLKEAILITVVLTLIIFLLSFYIMQYLKKNIKRLTMDMNTLAENDLSFEPHLVGSKDELGKLSVSVGSVISSLREIMTSVTNTAKQLSLSSSEMKDNSHEANESMNEIAKTIQEISEGANHQAEDAEQLVNEITSLGEVVEKNAESASELSIVSEVIKLASEEGLMSVNMLEDITKRNEVSFRTIFDIINTTHINAGQIGQAIEMISGVAQTTKLLSLNAAIEAARAGDAGRGFAVVADEINKLSVQTERSAKAIDEILKTLKENIVSANVQSQEVQAAVVAQTSSVADTKGKYLAIMDSLGNVNKEVLRLNEVSKDMEQSRNNVLSIGMNLSAISEENAASTQEASASTEEVLTAISRINNIGEKVDGFVVEVNTLVDRFQL